MTLQQIRYVVEVAEKGSITDAAKGLFISQPSLSAAVKELENELHIHIFVRSNRGIAITPEGTEFLGHARQILQQAELVEAKYIHGTQTKRRFAVSTQHYSFTDSAFGELIRRFGGQEYEFILRETTTYDIIQDVKSLRSELGILYISAFNSAVMNKLLAESNLIFTPLFTAKPHIFISRNHPLAGRELVDLEELADIPCLSFEQGEHNSIYFAEEALSALSPKKSIKITDRAAAINLLMGVGAYLITTGVLPSFLHGEDIVSVPLNLDEALQLGYITHRDYRLTHLGELYIQSLRDIVSGL